MADETANLNTVWAGLIIEELVRNDVTMFCMAPGSRCAPLTVAVARHPKAHSVVHFDERGAAYHALGFARATGHPVAFVCTSGTAVANAMPAVVEASQSHTPLILLTADRPPELLDVRANQAIDQTRIFGEYMRWDTVLPCPDLAIPPRMVLTTIDHAVYRARRSPAGPVHINCMYREPLVSDTPDFGSLAHSTELADWFADATPFTTTAIPATHIPDAELRELAKLLDTVEHGLLVIGELNTVAERQAAKALASALNWPTAPDVTSGLRFGEGGNPFLPYYDQALLSKITQRLLSPSCVLHIGGPFVSKRLQKFVEESSPLHYIVIAEHPRRQDPGHRVSARFEADIPEACAQLALLVSRKPSDNRTRELQDQTDRIYDVLSTELEDAGDLSEPAVAFLVSRHAPADSVVFLGASMPIRDMDMFGSASSARFRTAANRGASGIDGNIATAAGYARALNAPVTAILGDLAALHDLNSLALLQDLCSPLVLVVINNRGGGIFSFLPVAGQTDVFKEFFATPHDFDFANAATMFGLAYKTPATPAAFVTAYQAALQRNSATLIEVSSDRDANHRLHKSLQDKIVEWVEV